jgi:hypothetical protein
VFDEAGVTGAGAPAAGAASARLGVIGPNLPSAIHRAVTPSALWSAELWRSWRGALALFAAVALLGLLSLLRTPAPFIDEVWFANRAWGFVQTGLNFGTIDRGVFDRFDGYWTYEPWLPTFFWALSFRLLGLSLFALRLVSLVFGLVLLLALFVVADRLAGRLTALLTVLLVALSRAFLYSAHLGRPDVMAAASGFVALALFAAERSRRFSALSVLSGLAAGLAFEFHPYGYIYAPVLGLLYLLEYGRSLLRVGRFWGFMLGGAAGLAFYLVMHVLPYPETYLATSRLIAEGSTARTPPLISLDPRVWLQTAIDTAEQLVRQWNLRLPLVAGGLFVLWRSRGRSASDRTLLGICVVLLLAYALLIRNKNPWYAILAAPAGDLLAAVFLARVLRALRREPGALLPSWLPGSGGAGRAALWLIGRPAGRALGAAALLIALAVPTLIRAVPNPLDDYDDTLERLRAVVRPGSVVMGPATYWFGLVDETYLSWEHLVYYRRYAPGSTLGDALKEFRPDYFITDTYIERFIRDTPRSSINAQQIVIPRTELERFLAEHGRLVARVENHTYGQVQVYQIDWSRAAP